MNLGWGARMYSADKEVALEILVMLKVRNPNVRR